MVGRPGPKKGPHQNRYQEGQSETWLGGFLKGKRDRAVIGTKFTLIARDTTTGEVLEQRGTWIDLSGRGGGLSLWALIKKLIWKGD